MTGSLPRVLRAVLTSWVFASSALAADLDAAPPAFGYRNEQAVPVDFETVEVDLTFDAAARVATGRAHIVFRAGAAGMPFFDLVPNPTAITFNGEPVVLDDLGTAEPPGGETEVRVLRRSVVAGSLNELDINYTLSATDLSFGSRGVSAGFFTDDLRNGGRGFLEQFVPSNLEFDRVRYTFNVTVVGTGAEHEIFTNGDLEVRGNNTFKVVFPDYFTASSPYFHLTYTGRFKTSRFNFSGQAAQIPVTVYAEDQASADRAAADTRTILNENEATFGPFAHPRLVIYITPAGGGMEYCGATMTSEWALGHEITHSWFARGVMPTDGNSGWIDEAVASWRDDGYPRASSMPNRSPVNLSSFTPYRRDTTYEAYSLGAKLISELDRLYADQGGMRSILRALFAEKKNDTITIGYFKDFLERAGGEDLDAIFNRYVFGRGAYGEKHEGPVLSPEAHIGHHPRPYTREELQQYR